MPQIAQLATTWSSQIFWLLICFAVVYFVVGRGLLSGVVATIDQRAKTIADDLAAASAARDAATAEEAAWQAHHVAQRAEVHAIVAKAKHDAAIASEHALAAAHAKTDTLIAEAAERLAAARAAALAELPALAADLTQDVTQRVAGLTVANEDAAAAVHGVLAHG